MTRFLLAVLNGQGLWRKVLRQTGLAVVVCPTVNFWDLSGPVAVDVLHWSSPFQSIGFPRVLRSLGAAEHAVEEVEDEDDYRGSVSSLTEDLKGELKNLKPTRSVAVDDDEDERIEPSQFSPDFKWPLEERRTFNLDLSGAKGYKRVRVKLPNGTTLMFDL